MGLKKLKRNQKGFTLIEIIVVLAILAILIAVAIPTMNGILNDAKEKVVLADARAAYIAYVLKSTDSGTVGLEDITEYIGKASTDDVAIAIAPETGTLTDFYYRDKRLKENKYVHIPLNGTAVILESLPTTATPLS